MLRFLVVRAALLLLALLVASVAIFATLRVLPGDVAQVIGGLKADPDQVQRIRVELGLDRSPITQYLDWLGGLLRLDLGRSLLTGRPVAEDIGSRLTVTLPLTALSLLVTLLVAFPLGIWSGLRHDRRTGIVISFASQTLSAVPALWAGLLLVLLLGKGVGLVGLLPTNGFPDEGWSDPLAALRSLALPALTVGLIEGALLLRFVRSAVLEALSQDFVRAAAARGLTRTKSLLTHGLPSVGLSLVSITALQVAGLVTGAVLVEALFNLPGVGRMLVDDVGSRDLVKVQSEILFLTAIVLVIGALVDVVHRVVDPRQRQLT